MTNVRGGGGEHSIQCHRICLNNSQHSFLTALSLVMIIGCLIGSYSNYKSPVISSTTIAYYTVYEYLLMLY